ncbi:putative exonuclease [Phaeomoniella chlamydospora]|uniref:Putative exonuclease n=1 Tax=Phaeomoniella chlamydospora TaxID=158046 RepID=A0A0G2GML4_PHACM|nr:putative exonuclease [Phaeomoniella chlamydospora]
MSQEKKRKLDEYAEDLSSTVEYIIKDVNEHVQAVNATDARPKDPPENGKHFEKSSQNESTGHVLVSDTDAQIAGWTIVDRKRQRRKRSEKDGTRMKYPELVFSSSLQKPIKLGELQNIILYTLADGIGPTWVGFKYPGHTKKVVCLMVPGLEMSMFDGTTALKHNTTGGSQIYGIGGSPTISAAESIKDPSFGRNGGTDNSAQGNPLPISDDSLAEPLKPLAKIFEQVWPVRAPGDSKYNRIHSPIQALLVAPLPQSQEEKKMKGPRPVKESQSFQPARTLVSELILTPDDLREAEYPMHPASSDTPEELAVEQERREKLGQTVTNGWVDTSTNLHTQQDSDTDLDISSNDLSGGRKVLAIDCEMVLTIDDRHSLARISVLDWNGTTVMDEFVKPSLPIKNYFTEYSGITPTILEPVTTTLHDIQLRLLSLITPSTVLLGHSLESDLSAMRLTHPHIIDTSLLYPHPRGPPLRSSLKYLTQKYLRREIQLGGAKGHDSVEDALAVLDLVKLKCEKGPKFGTSEMSGESIFRRLSRAKSRTTGNPRTSAIVDHGTPERGFGREATFALGCKNDDEVVTGIQRAVNGDPDGSQIPGSGVDFTWARLRELESHLGWCNNHRDYTKPDNLHQKPQSPSPTTTTSSSSSSSSETLSRTITRITQIHSILPSTTLFIVYTGTGDPREVGRLQALHRQFKREYTVKKWDELSVKWGDKEQQGLRKAVEKAREGIAFLGVK